MQVLARDVDAQEMISGDLIEDAFGDVGGMMGFPGRRPAAS